MIAELDGLYARMRPAKAVTRILSRFLFEGRAVPARWQWTNHLNEAFLKSALYMPAVKRVEKPILILGSGRSGTTILAKVLSMHRDLGLLNEPKLMWHIAYPDEDLAGSYSTGGARYRLGADEATSEVRRAVQQMYGFYLRAVCAERVLDKYPEMIFRVPFVLSILPDAKLVFIVRNGMDTAYSVARWCERYSHRTRHGEWITWWGVNDRKWKLLVSQLVATDPVLSPLTEDIQRLSRHVDKAAVEWIVTMREGLRLLEQTPEVMYPVRYEELTTSPQDTLDGLAVFCELPPDGRLVEYGCRILHPRPAGPGIDLDPSIRPLFEDTMRRMGYL